MSVTRTDMNGFTLVEIMATIVIAAIFLGSISLIVSNDSKISEKVRDETVLNSYVENKAEELRSAGFLGLANGTASLASELPGELAGPKTGTTVTTDFAAGIKKVVISISYNAQGVQKSHVYTTLVGELGVGQY